MVKDYLSKVIVFSPLLFQSLQPSWIKNKKCKRVLSVMHLIERLSSATALKNYIYSILWQQWHYSSTCLVISEWINGIYSAPLVILLTFYLLNSSLLVIFFPPCSKSWSRFKHYFLWTKQKLTPETSKCHLPFHIWKPREIRDLTLTSCPWSQRSSMYQVAFSMSKG